MIKNSFKLLWFKMPFHLSLMDIKSQQPVRPDFHYKETCLSVCSVEYSINFHAKMTKIIKFIVYKDPSQNRLKYARKPLFLL